MAESKSTMRALSFWVSVKVLLIACCWIACVKIGEDDGRSDPFNPITIGVGEISDSVLLVYKPVDTLSGEEINIIIGRLDGFSTRWGDSD